MHFIVASYSFFTVPDPTALKVRLMDLAEKLEIEGLAIVASEGINGTFSTSNEASRGRLCEELKNISGDLKMEFKFSESEKAPFRSFQVKLRDEIVSLGAPDLVPNAKKNFHLTPTQWNEVLKKEKDFVLIDTRNDYEYRIGTFKGSVNPNTQKFSEFPEFLNSKKLDPEKKVLIFCTGGIRCEKGILELQRKGFNNVYQLDGGILNYLKEFPNDQFDGECLVFDNRVAVDQTLQPSKTYSWCPHCGEPADQKISCGRCGTDASICWKCSEISEHHQTCSKNCRNILIRDDQLQVKRPRK